MKTVRHQIIDELTARVSGTRELESFDIRDLPITVILAGDDAPNGDIYDTTPLTFEVTVARAIALQDTDKNGTWHDQAEVAYGDLVVEVMGADRSLGGLATHLIHTGGGIGAIENSSDSVTAQATFQVNYRIATGDPYSIDPSL